MTFADLMSLLLAFFVLLFSFSELDKAKYKQVAGSMQNAFGVQREIKIKEPPKGINIIAQEFTTGTPDPTVTNSLRQHTTDDFRQYLKMPKPSDGGKGEGSISIEEAGKRLRNIFSSEIEEGLVEIDMDNPRIIVRILERGSFTSGSTNLIEPFKSIIAKMATVVAVSPGTVVVAGHTDNVPIYNARFRSNWELSASRAVTVVHELLKEAGAAPARYRIEGYSDTRPIDSNETREGRARNRRVEVTLLYDDPIDTTKDNAQVEPVKIPPLPSRPDPTKKSDAPIKGSISQFRFPG